MHIAKTEPVRVLIVFGVQVGLRKGMVCADQDFHREMLRKNIHKGVARTPLKDSIACTGTGGASTGRLPTHGGHEDLETCQVQWGVNAEAEEGGVMLVASLLY
ncbi:hypothetical protein EVAR_86808_1 [Eumeta japonica]|uniref:Uncharacterized protein n=1 Tax=Eumeta variegata TaxID=151549 RepID=A0A4C1VRW3_EUMVA|nr:hypothetical protein EVAR_86808_1 [Eumeta japonica]